MKILRDCSFKFGRLLPDRIWSSMLYQIKMGKKLDLKNLRQLTKNSSG